MIWWWWFISTSDWIRPHYAFGAGQLIILTSRLSTIYFLYIFNICHFPDFFVAKFQEFEEFFFQGNWHHQRKKCVHSLFMNVIFVAKKWKNLASSWLWKKHTYFTLPTHQRRFFFFEEMIQETKNKGQLCITCMCTFQRFFFLSIIIKFYSSLNNCQLKKNAYFKISEF